MKQHNGAFLKFTENFTKSVEKTRVMKKLGLELT